MTSVYDQYSTSTSSRANSVNRPSVVPISALLNPEPDGHVVSPASTTSTTSTKSTSSTTTNSDNYESIDD
ncbi:11065_t:CDS:1, partial [Racocetra persica]